jgi:phenylalanyl-tRNA synthetase alpha chain
MLILQRRLIKSLPRYKRNLCSSHVHNCCNYSTNTGETFYNITPQIESKINRNLHLKEKHPLSIIRTRIQSCPSLNSFKRFDNISPKVSTLHNFDALLIPNDHISRSLTDTYYYDRETVLRTHTTAHQVPLLMEGHEKFLITGDVYRRDDIDATHYPVFHQMDGVKLFHLGQTPVFTREDIVKELKSDLETMIQYLFGNRVTSMRWIDEYFPFTDPSFELEIEFNGEWLEVLGCGLIRESILTNAGKDKSEYQGYAFGLGLERLAMILFNIPDIRLFWSTDPRFLSQFESIDPNNPNDIVHFKPYSKYPLCYKDISFWLPTAKFADNDFYEIVRNIAGDLAESVKIVDNFTHPKTGRTSKCYRINYRSIDRTLTNEEIDQIQWKLRDEIVAKLGVELR